MALVSALNEGTAEAQNMFRDLSQISPERAARSPKAVRNIHSKPSAENPEILDPKP